MSRASRRRATCLAVLLVALGALGVAGSAGGATASTASRILYVNGGRFDFITPTGKAAGSIPIPERQFYGPDDVTVSAGARRIALLQSDGGAGAAFGRFDISLYRAGRRGLEEVPNKKPQLNDTTSSVALSPDGRMLAVSIKPSIVLIDLETGRRRPLRHATLLRPDGQPSFTAAGRHLVFTHTTVGTEAGTEIYESNLQGGELRRLNYSPGVEVFPRLSPDGRLLTFLRKGTGSKGEYEVVVASAEGTEERVVGHTDYALGGPSFSPDGKQIVFTSSPRSEVHEAGPYTIRTASVEGGGSQVILRSQKGPLLAQWVPGG